MLKWRFKAMSLIWEMIWEWRSRTEARRIPAKGPKRAYRYCVCLGLSPIAGQEPWVVSPPTPITCCWGLFTGVSSLAVLTCPVSVQRPSLWLAQTTGINFPKVLEARSPSSQWSAVCFCWHLSFWLTGGFLLPASSHGLSSMWVYVLTSSYY